jgi:hypothetical protein
MPTNVSRGAHTWAAIAIVFVVALGVWNGDHVSHHVLLNRDPGSYVTTGRWIARHGNLEADVSKGPLAHDPNLSFSGPAVFNAPGGKLEFQFAHLLPVVMAEARSVGGDNLMFRTPALLASAGLLALFVLAWRLLRSAPFALAATVAFALAIPEVSFSRDAVSELPTQVLVFTGLWLLTIRRRMPSVAAVAAAGVFLGLTQAVRIDALALLVAAPAVVAICWLRTPREQHRALNIRVLAFVVGLVPGVVLGVTDLALRSTRYWNALGSQVRSLVLAFVAVCVVSVLAVWLWPRVQGVLTRWQGAIATIGALGVVVVAFAAWFLRPHVQTTRNAVPGLVPTLQRYEHLTLDPTRGYYEYSMHWMSWYLGPITVVAAIIGAALLLYALVRGHWLHTIPALACLAPSTALYLWNAKAFSDQVWVMRRFLVGGLPVFALLAAGLGAWLFTRPKWWWRAVGVALAIGLVAYPAWTLKPVRSMTEQRGYLTPVNEVCDRVGPDGTIVILPTGGPSVVAAQALRAWCGVDVALANTADAKDLQRLAGDLKQEGRRLWIVTDDTQTINRLFPGAQAKLTDTVTNNRVLDITLMHRPSVYRTQSFALATAPVPTTSSGNSG